MINVQPYIDKLEVLKEYMNYTVDSVQVFERYYFTGSFNEEGRFIGLQYGFYRYKTFEQFYQSKINPL